MEHSHSGQEKLSNISWLNKIFYDHEINRYGIISMLILLIGCGGGIAVGLGGLNSAVQLFILVLSTMLSLSMILAVAPMKTIIYTALLAVTIDIVIIVYNFLV